MTVKGFEPLPPNRLVPKTRAIDHSATNHYWYRALRFYISDSSWDSSIWDFMFLYFKSWLRNPVQLKLVPLFVALNENSFITLARKRIELMTSALLARRSNQLS